MVAFGKPCLRGAGELEGFFGQPQALRRRYANLNLQWPHIIWCFSSAVTIRSHSPQRMRPVKANSSCDCGRGFPSRPSNVCTLSYSASVIIRCPYGLGSPPGRRPDNRGRCVAARGYKRLRSIQKMVALASTCVADWQRCTSSRLRLLQKLSMAALS